MDPRKEPYMSRTALIIITLVLGATISNAATFVPTPYLEEQGVDVLSRQTAHALVDRELFGNPYATVVVGHVDVYEGFPYLESRWFQVVSDPEWNRLLHGEIGQGLEAYDGSDDAFGKLDAPHGMSTDGDSRVFVADTGNDRVLAFAVVTEFERMHLEPLFAVEGLSSPYDVAFSDGGTPLQRDDDLLYVANSGRNEVVSYRIGEDRAVLSDRIGELGSGDGSFAGPMALTVGRRDGANTQDVYVSDAHNRRVVHLRDEQGTLRWNRSLPHDLGMVSSLDTDHWGNVYAAAPQEGVIVKYTPDMLPIARLSEGVDRPRSVHIPYVRVEDHRSGEVRGVGQGSALVVEQWDGNSGLRLMTLGVELSGAAVLPGQDPSFEFTVSDRARVDAEIVDPGSGRVVASLASQELDAGRHVLEFSAEDFVSAWSSGEYQLRLSAASTYDAGITDTTELSFALNGEGGPELPSKPTLLGNVPNPFNPSTAIRFVVPNGPALAYRVEIYDAAGRVVRHLDEKLAAPGLNEVIWNGKDDQGASVGSGVYLYRLELGAERLVSKMVLVK
jgi:hypothetical protein